MTMLDPRQLNIFLTAAETLNFSKAARRMHMSQPAVTQHIRALENQLGKPLFLRHGNRLALSESGEALLPLARQLVVISLRTQEIISSEKRDMVGNLMIGCTTTPGRYLLPSLLVNFLKRYPNVRVCCNYVPRAVALEMLSEGMLHLTFASSPDQFTEAIEFVKVYEDPVVLIAPADHPWVQRGTVTLEDFDSEPFILREQGAGSYQALRTGLANLGMSITDLHTVLTLGNSESVVVAVQNGIGVGFVSRMVCRYVGNQKVRVVPVEGLNLKQEIYLCHYRYHPAPWYQAAFWEYIQGEGLDRLNQLLSEEQVN